VSCPALAEWQESSEDRCNTEARYQLWRRSGHNSNWSTVDPKYPAKTDVTRLRRMRRADEAIKWLRGRRKKALLWYPTPGSVEGEL